MIYSVVLTDLLVGVFSVLPDLVQRFTIQWLAGEAMCKIVRFGMVNITIKNFSIFYFLPETLDLFQTISSSKKKTKQNKVKPAPDGKSVYNDYSPNNLNQSWYVAYVV